MRLTCPNCGYTTRSDVILPFRCSCGYSTNASEDLKVTTLEGTLFYSTTQLWLNIHSKLGEYIKNNNWDAEECINWYEISWKPFIPACCSKNFEELLLEFPIDWATAETAFKSLWKLHNEVSTRHANKPTLTLEEALEKFT